MDTATDPKLWQCPALGIGLGAPSEIRDSNANALLPPLLPLLSAYFLGMLEPLSGLYGTVLRAQAEGFYTDLGVIPASATAVWPWASNYPLCPFVCLSIQ